MAEELAGKVAIVTGGCSGIGLSAVERFLAEGAQVVIADLDQEQGSSLARQLGAGAAFQQTDVAEPDQIRDLVDFTVDRFGGLHVMLNNAGISGARHPRLLDEDFADFERVMAVNLLGVMAGTKEAARHMSEHGGGSIINISSIGGIQPAPALWAYHTSKTSVIFFTKCAAIDLGEFDIRVNCIAPGNIETPILSSVVASGLPPEEKEELMRTIREYILSRQPLHKQGKPDDTAQAALYFASDRSSYVTGTLLPVDGGLTAGNPSSAGGFEEARKRRSAD